MYPCGRPSRLGFVLLPQNKLPLLTGTSVGGGLATERPVLAAAVRGAEGAVNRVVFRTVHEMCLKTTDGAPLAAPKSPQRRAQGGSLAPGALAIPDPRFLPQSLCPASPNRFCPLLRACVNCPQCLPSGRIKAPARSAGFHTSDRNAVISSKECDFSLSCPPPIPTSPYLSLNIRDFRQNPSFLPVRPPELALPENGRGCFCERGSGGQIRGRGPHLSRSPLPSTCGIGPWGQPLNRVTLPLQEVPRKHQPGVAKAEESPKPAPEKERKKFRHRPEPLFIPPPPSYNPAPAASYSYSGATLYQSQLRSPRVLGDHLLLDPAHELPAYTPPPMLSPVRQGSGLFSNVLLAGQAPGAHPPLPLTPLTPTPRVLLCRSSESPLHLLRDPGGFTPPVLGVALGRLTFMPQTWRVYYVEWLLCIRRCVGARNTHEA